MLAVKPLSVASALGLLAILSMAPATFAHPMGNFSINHYSKIISGPRAIEIDYIIDMAEIPTFQQIQESGIVPKEGDPSLGAYLERQAASLKGGLSIVRRWKSPRDADRLPKGHFSTGRGRTADDEDGLRISGDSHKRAK